MDAEHPESWLARAQRVLVAEQRHSGAAREALLEQLEEQTCALSALEMEEALRRRGRRVARASVYRILDELERLGLVQRVQVGQAMARYEPVRAGEGHHHHLVCDSCGRITPFRDPALERVIESLSARLPMRVAEHEIVLRGACRNCASPGRTRSRLPRDHQAGEPETTS
jgi:Fur family ferric uptake transcriptional regulator